MSNGFFPEINFYTFSFQSILLKTKVVYQIKLFMYKLKLQITKNDIYVYVLLLFLLELM